MEDIFTKSVSELIHWIRMQFSYNWCELQVEEKGTCLNTDNRISVNVLEHIQQLNNFSNFSDIVLSVKICHNARRSIRFTIGV